MSFIFDVGATAETTFSLAGRQLKFDSKHDISTHLTEFAAQPKVVKLDISGNTIGIEASEALASAIGKHADTLREVNFSDIYTGRLNTEIPQSLDHLLPALLQCPNLTVVNLCDNAFGLQTIEPIERYLARAVSVEHLVLSNNGMGPFAGTRIGKCLFKLAGAKKSAGKPSLKTFICGRNRLENGSVNYLAIGLRAHESLHSVRLYQNGIRPAGVAKLIREGLCHNKKLAVLDLQDNTLTTSAAEVLAFSLSAWPDLEELNLNDALLKNKGSLALAKSLRAGKSKKLVKLKLQYNELEADSLAELAEAVSLALPALTLVELNGNRFEEDSEDLSRLQTEIEARGGEIDELDDLEEIDSEDEEEEDDDEQDTYEDEDADLNSLEKELSGVTLSESDSLVDQVADDLAATHLK